MKLRSLARLKVYFLALILVGQASNSFGLLTFFMDDIVRALGRPIDP
jgi:hypothetical protein